MASFGRVLDLLDERYLQRVQDVTGNVEPMPTLVPYDEWKHDVIVYRTDIDHDMFLNLMQDFTANMSTLLGKELWTWCVQWEVDDPGVSLPSPKKPRLEISHAGANPPQLQTPQRKPIIDRIHRCIIDPELMQEEEMLRALINIVQVESSTVPNVIEWLYQWIDHFEGDGTALKAALMWEIPSLWDFEYHPLLVPEDVKRAVEETAEQSQTIDANPTSQRGKTAMPLNVQELVHGSPTKKIRAKPVLAAMEQRIEESERLKYCEVRYGIKPPDTEQPLPPLINIPQDEVKRIKYYNACYRSRHRALVLLLEAGISLPQISSYVKGQEHHPRDTPVPKDPASLGGLKHYEKDSEAGQDYYKIRGQLKLQAAKQNEIATSNRLELDVQLGTSATASRASTHVPLIPQPPVDGPRLDTTASIWTRLEAAKAKGVHTINFVPTPLVGGLKSKYLAHARDRREMQGFRGGRMPSGWYGMQPRWYDYGNIHESESDEEKDYNGWESDSDTDGGAGHDGDDDGDSGGLSGQGPTHISSDVMPYMPSNINGMQPPTLSFQNSGPQLEQHSQAQAGNGFFQTMAPQGAAQFLPRVPQDMGGMYIPQETPDLFAAGSSSSFSAVRPWITNPTRPSTQTSSSVNSATSSGNAFQPQSSTISLPLRPPPFTGAPVGSMAPRPPQGTIPPQPPPFISPSASASGGSRWTLDMFRINSHAQHPPTTAATPDPPAAFCPNQEVQQTAVDNGRLWQAPMPCTVFNATPRPDFPTSGPEATWNIDSQNTNRPMPSPNTIAPPQFQPPRVPALGPVHPLRPDPPSISAPSLPLLPAPAPAPAPQAQRTPIHMFFPKILVPATRLHPPPPTPQTNNTNTNTNTNNPDNHLSSAFLLGHTYPASGKITLTHALFLPLAFNPLTTQQNQSQPQNSPGPLNPSILETYPSSLSALTGLPLPNYPPRKCHVNAYHALRTALSLMVPVVPHDRDGDGDGDGDRDGDARERQLSKRWRASVGPMTRTERGAVWEGWGLRVDREVGMGRAEREGLRVVRRVVDDGVEGGRTQEEEVRYRELMAFVGMDDEEWEEWEEWEEGGDDNDHDHDHDDDNDDDDNDGIKSAW